MLPPSFRCERYAPDCTTSNRRGCVVPPCAQECAALSRLPTVAGSGTLGRVQPLNLGLIRREKLGVPQSARDVFTLLAGPGRIALPLAEQLRHMVGFRNIAVHDDQALQLPITVSIITGHLDEFLQYSEMLLRRGGNL